MDLNSECILFSIFIADSTKYVAVLSLKLVLKVMYAVNSCLAPHLISDSEAVSLSASLQH